MHRWVAHPRESARNVSYIGRAGFGIQLLRISVINQRKDRSSHIDELAGHFYSIELYRKALQIARRTCDSDSLQDAAVLTSIDFHLAEWHECFGQSYVSRDKLCRDDNCDAFRLSNARRQRRRLLHRPS